MPIPTALKQTVDQEIADYCDQKVPPQVLDKVRLVHQWRGNWVTLVEQRPYWKDPTGGEWLDSPVAQFRYDEHQNDWTLHWRDRNQRWHPYDGLPGSRSISRLLAEVDQDPTGIFWG